MRKERKAAAASTAPAAARPAACCGAPAAVPAVDPAAPPGTAVPAGSSTLPLTSMTSFFKAFCNETRMSIIEYLMSGEKCVCEISALLGSSQPLISHHLAVLLRAGFVGKRGEGARTYYRIDWERFDARFTEFHDMTSALRAQDAGSSDVCG